MSQLQTENTAVHKHDLHYGIAGTLTAVIGYVVLFVLPVLLESAAVQLKLTDQQVGWLGFADSGGIALATLLAVIFLNRLNFHYLTLVGIAIAVAANLLSMGITDFGLLASYRVVAGFGAGMIIAAAITSIGQTSNPDRWFGIYTAVVVVEQAGGLFFLPAVFERWQLEGLYAVIAMLYLLPLFTLRWLPRNNHSCAPQQLSSTVAQSSGVMVMALAAVMLFYVNIGAFWTYVGGMGTKAGYSLEFVSEALTLAMIGGFIGATLVAIMGKRAQGSLLMLISTVATVVCLWLLNGLFSQQGYIWITAIYSVVWSILAARLYAVVAFGDPSGRYVTATQPVVAVGFALGPLIAAELVGPYGYTGVNVLAGIAVVLCFIAIVPLARREK